MTGFETLVGIMRRLLDPDDAMSLRSVDDAMFRELREVLEADAAPSARDSRIRSNLRFFVSMA